MNTTDVLRRKRADLLARIAFDGQARVNTLRKQIFAALHEASRVGELGHTYLPQVASDATGEHAAERAVFADDKAGKGAGR